MEQDGYIFEPIPEQTPSQPEPQIEFQPEPQTQPQPESVSWAQAVNQQASTPYRMRFADCPYETPHGEIYQKPAKQKKKSAGTVLLSVCLAFVLTLICCGLTVVGMNLYWENRLESAMLAADERYNLLQSQLNQNQTGGTTVVAPHDPGTAMTPGQVYAQNVDSVVAITVQIKGSSYGQSGVYASSGSGFLISSDGYIVSNHHVVEGAGSITVTMTDGMTYNATLVGSDDTNDVALLKVDGEGFPFAVLGSSDAMAVGDQVAAIGNPLGELTSTLTVGYVSAKDRMVATDGSSINMLQTDAAINSGNSGGPLFNMYGEVVGITTAKFSGVSSGGASIEGISFAIPMDDVVDILADLREFGYVTSAYLGVMVRDVSQQGIQDGLPAGAYVESVTAGTGAQEAGLQARDIIVNLAGYKVSNVAELTRVLRKLDPGMTVSITVYRGGTQVQLSITLGELPGTTTTEPTYPMPGDEGFEEWYKEFMDGYFGND